MTARTTLYMFNGSAPSLSARLMLEHKGLEYRCKHLVVGPHAFAMPPRGFDMMTVPAVKIAGQRIQGSRVVYPHASALVRPAQRVSRGLVIRPASAGHHATDFAAGEDLAALPRRLDEIDAWIDDGLLDSGDLNAADFQVAPNIALLLRFDDLAVHIKGRAAAQLARRLIPNADARIGAVLPDKWLAPLRASSSSRPDPAP